MVGCVQAEQDRCGNLKKHNHPNWSFRAGELASTKNHPKVCLCMPYVMQCQWLVVLSVEYNAIGVRTEPRQAARPSRFRGLKYLLAVLILFAGEITDSEGEIQWKSEIWRGTVIGRALLDTYRRPLEPADPLWIFNSKFEQPISALTHWWGVIFFFFRTPTGQQSRAGQLACSWCWPPRPEPRWLPASCSPRVPARRRVKSKLCVQTTYRLRVILNSIQIEEHSVTTRSAATLLSQSSSPLSTARSISMSTLTRRRRRLTSLSRFSPLNSARTTRRRGWDDPAQGRQELQGHLHNGHRVGHNHQVRWSRYWRCS